MLEWLASWFGYGPITPPINGGVTIKWHWLIDHDHPEDLTEYGAAQRRRAAVEQLRIIAPYAEKLLEIVDD